MGTTGIEWAHDSANVASGCTEARHADGTMSEECVRCYARLQSARMTGLMLGGAPSPRKERIAALYDGVAERAGRGARWTGVLRWDRGLLESVFDGLRPGRRTFLGSMTDLWHPDHDPALGVALAGAIRHVASQPAARRPGALIMLSKRSAAQRAWAAEHFPEGLPDFVWPGVTAGTQRSASERVFDLAQISARVRVVSVEPLLSPVSFGHLTLDVPWAGGTVGGRSYTPVLGRLGWVIAGCESGIGRRATDPAWVRALRDECVGARVPFFLKQLDVGGEVVGTPEIDGRTWTQVPLAA